MESRETMVLPPSGSSASPLPPKAPTSSSASGGGLLVSEGIRTGGGAMESPGLFGAVNFQNHHISSGESHAVSVSVSDGSMQAPTSDYSTAIVPYPHNPGMGRMISMAGPARDQRHLLGKRKRGRPRKYGPDGTVSLSFLPVPLSSASPSLPPTITTTPTPTTPTTTHTPTTPTTAATAATAIAATTIAAATTAAAVGATAISSSTTTTTIAGGGGGGIVVSGPLGSPLSPKRGRGRPLGSGKNQQLAALGLWLAGSAGAGFTPHVITVAAGEDVAAKIMSFSQQGPRSICILSANGAISSVTLRQPATSGGTVSYEGRFEILSLSGSFLLTETGGTRSRTGGLSVSLAGPDGRVVGGCIAGLLMAASPIQVVVGSFMPHSQKVQAVRPITAADPTQPKSSSIFSASTTSKLGDPQFPLSQSTIISFSNNNNNNNNTTNNSNTNTNINTNTTTATTTTTTTNTNTNNSNNPPSQVQSQGPTMAIPLSRLNPVLDASTYILPVDR